MNWSVTVTRRYLEELRQTAPAAYVVAHAEWARRRGKRPSVPFLSERNPQKALGLALKYFKREHVFAEDFGRNCLVGSGGRDKTVRWKAWREGRPTVLGYGMTRLEAIEDVMYRVQPDHDGDLDHMGTPRGGPVVGGNMYTDSSMRGWNKSLFRPVRTSPPEKKLPFGMRVSNEFYRAAAVTEDSIRATRKFLNWEGAMLIAPGVMLSWYRGICGRHICITFHYDYWRENRNSDQLNHYIRSGAQRVKVSPSTVGSHQLGDILAYNGLEPESFDEWEVARRVPDILVRQGHNWQFFRKPIVIPADFTWDDLLPRVWLQLADRFELPGGHIPRHARMTANQRRLSR